MCCKPILSRVLKLFPSSLENEIILRKSRKLNHREKMKSSRKGCRPDQTLGTGDGNGEKDGKDLQRTWRAMAAVRSRGSAVTDDPP